MVALLPLCCVTGAIAATLLCDGCYCCHSAAEGYASLTRCVMLQAGIIGEPSMVDGMVDIASSLNERYNLSKKERVWSNIDVPGFVRSSIPLLKRAGITALRYHTHGPYNTPSLHESLH